LKNFKNINLGITNSFLIEANNGYFLVDTGLQNSYKSFLKKLKKNSIELKDIKYIILTHHHFDHTGFLAKILTENKNIKLIVHKNELKALSKGESILGEKALLTKSFSLFTQLKPNYGKFDSVFIRKQDIILDEKDFSLKKFGIDAKIVFTPGHTEGSISILFDNGDTIVGDLIINIKLVRGFKPFVADSYEEIIKSLKKINERGAKTLYPSHGKKVDINKVFNYLF